MPVRNSLLSFLIVLALLAITVSAHQADSGKFRVGAMRIDVTPPPQELPKPYLDVWERIYARTIVVDNGKTRAPYLFPDPFYVKR